jgi:hypothetical protein
MDLIITAPRTGIAPSAHTGIADIRNLDIFSIPGIVKLNNPAVKKSTTVVGLVKWMVKNPATPAEIYALDDGGKIYKSANSGATWTLMENFTAGGHGNGLAIWKNYLFVALDTKIDVCGDGTATGITNANWSLDWEGSALDSDVLWHPMLVSKNDNKLYIGAGRYVASLDENTGQTFAPGTGATYTYIQQALDLPPNYRIKCLEELGNNLMCGTWMGTNIYDLRVADIFPWDRSSPSFGQPVQIAEHGIHGMLNNGNYLIIMAGIEGKIYRSDGVNAVPIAQIPSTIADISGGKYFETYPGAIINYKGRPFFGVSGGGTATTIDGCGVYSLSITGSGTILAMEHGISSGNFGATTNVKIGSLLGITRDSLTIGWKDAATYGIDLTNVAAYNTSYSAFFISPFYNVGTTKQPRKFTEIEFQLVRPLRTDEGIKVDYRTDLTSAFINLGTWDYATFGAKISMNPLFQKGTTSIDIPICENIQLKVYLTGTTTSCELKSVILR